MMKFTIMITYYYVICILFNFINVKFDLEIRKKIPALKWYKCVILMIFQYRI